MDFDTYRRFIVGASTTDPRPLLEAEKKLAPVIDAGQKIHIVTEHPTDHRELALEIDIADGHGVMSYGLRNFPDGEIFTSPNANSTEGEIFVDLPVNYGGNDICGIYLRFEGGKIIEYRADEGHEHLAAIIETDDGSHRLGEVALGMNPGLDRVLKHPLFVEKVGGTLHIAIGASYEDCYVDDPGSDEGKAKNRGTRGIGSAQPVGSTRRHRHRLPDGWLRSLGSRGWCRAGTQERGLGGCGMTAKEKEMRPLEEIPPPQIFRRASEGRSRSEHRPCGSFPSRSTSTRPARSPGTSC